MAIRSRYVFIANMDIDSEKEELFNDVYNNEQIPRLSEVPGVLSIARFKSQELKLVFNGDLRTIVVEDEPKYSTVYELEHPVVTTGDKWAEAVRHGRWHDEVSPYVRNHRYVLKQRIFPEP